MIESITLTLNPIRLFVSLGLLVALTAPGPWAASAQRPAGMVPDEVAAKGQGPKARRPQLEPTSELLVFMAPGSSPAGVAREHGLAFQAALRGGRDFHVLRADSPAAAVALRARLARDKRVRAVYPNLRTA